MEVQPRRGWREGVASLTPAMRCALLAGVGKMARSPTAYLTRRERENEVRGLSDEIGSEVSRGDAKNAKKE